MTPRAATNEFARVLDEALQRRDLTLQRVAEHLLARGQSVSSATLSLWRRGRTRPTIKGSAVTLGVLEEVLWLEAGALTAALAEPNPQDPRWWDREVAIHDYSDTHQAFRDFRAAVGLADLDSFERVQVHTRVDIGDDCSVERMVHSVVLRAKHDGAEDFAVFFHTDNLTHDGQPVLYELGAVHGGSVRARVEFGQLGASAGLIRLDHPLGAGELTSLSVEWCRVTEGPPVRPEGDSYQMRSPWPIGHLGIEACFRGRLPSRVRSWAVPKLAAADGIEDQEFVELTPAECVQVAVDDAVGGGVRLEWSWEDG